VGDTSSLAHSGAPVARLPGSISGMRDIGDVRGMGFGSQSRYASGKYDYELSAPSARPQRMVAGAALGCVALTCAWTLCANFANGSTGPADITGTRASKFDLVANFVDRFVAPGPKLTAASKDLAAKFLASRIPAANDPPSTSSLSHAVVAGAAAAMTYASLFDQRFLGGSPGTFAGKTFTDTPFGQRFAMNTPPQSNDGVEASAPARTVMRQAQQIPPLPQTNPRANISVNKDGVTQSAAASAPQHAPQIRNASLHDRAQDHSQDRSQDRTADNAPAEPTFLEKIFGKRGDKPSGPSLAYAATDDAGLGGGYDSSGHFEGQTAVYNISTHTVTMPDGSRLEAHSGLGSLLDDPSHADARNRGVTPPTVYDLEMREAPFHGVEALRLIPVDESKVYGRSGLLAHSFMLGPNGDSNGCVSFKNYDAFLRAYKNHEIKRLVVVAGNS
jgi:hypothetical protein